MNNDEKCKVVVVEAGASRLVKADSKFVYHKEPVRRDMRKGICPYHMYMLSEESIASGDWYFDIVTNNWYKAGDSPVTMACFKRIIATTNPELEIGLTHKFGVIIKSIPRPSDSFIEKYCKVGGIDSVMIEHYTVAKVIGPSRFNNGHPIGTTVYIANDIRAKELSLTGGMVYTAFSSIANKNMDWFGYPETSLKVIGKVIRLAPDNTITTLPIKTTWDRDEVIQLLNSLKVTVHPVETSMAEMISNSAINERVDLLLKTI